MVKSEQNSDHKYTYKEQDRVERDRYKSPSRTSQTTTDKMTVMLSLRTFEDMPEKHGPYKRPNDTSLKTLTSLVDHYERTPKHLPSLNPDFQTINQSSQAIQSTLEALNNLFSSEYLISTTFKDMLHFFGTLCLFPYGTL